MAGRRFAAAAGDDTSILRRLARHRVPGVFGWMEPDGLRGSFDPAPRSPQQHRPLSRIVLLKGHGECVSGDALGVYLDAVEREFSSAYGDRVERVEVFLRVEIYPGEPARVTERSDPDDVCVAELVERVPLPPVTGGVVAFECRLTNRSDV